MGRASIGATGDFEATETGSASVSTSSGQESKDLTRLAKLRKRMRHAISTYNGELQHSSSSHNLLIDKPCACTRAPICRSYSVNTLRSSELQAWYIIRLL